MTSMTWQTKQRTGGLKSLMCLGLSTERILSAEGIKTVIDSTERFFGSDLAGLAINLQTHAYPTSNQQPKPEVGD